MPLILHIGSGKTGTTSIQEWLASSAIQKHSSIVYPIVSEMDHNCLEALVRPAEKWHRVNRIKFGDDSDALIKRAQKLAKIVKAKLKAGKKVLLSSEYLFSFPQAEIVPLLKHLGASHDQVHVVAVIRHPRNYFCSNMQQVVKHDFRISPPTLSQYGFKRSICSWRNVVGNNSISVLGFEPEISAHGDIVKAFCRLIKEELAVQISAPPASRSANVSMSSEEAIVAQDIKFSFSIRPRQRLHELNRAINGFVKEATKGLILTKAEFIPEVGRGIDGMFASDLEWLQSYYGVSFCLDEETRDLAPGDKARGKVGAKAEGCSVFDEYSGSDYLPLSGVLQHDPMMLAKLRIRTGLMLQKKLQAAVEP